MRSGIVVDLVQAHYSHSEEDFRRIVDGLIETGFPGKEIPEILIVRARAER